MLVVLGQLGLLGAGEPLSWDMLLFWCVGSVWLDLGVSEQGAEKSVWCVAAGALSQSPAGVNTAAFRSALPVYTGGSELLPLTLALWGHPVPSQEC